MAQPPLYFWLTALVYHTIGVNEFAARFWSAAFGFGAVALTLWFGLRLFSWPVGIAAALLLLSIDQSTFCHWYNFVCQARVGMLETTSTFWLILAWILVWEANERPRLIILVGVTAGLAVMTKAWIGFFALAMPLLYALITRQFHARRQYWSLAILLASVIILPWHFWQIWIHGGAFLHDYFTANLFGRIGSALETHRHSAFFYFDVLREGFSILGSGYLWPAAYLWAAWTAPRKESRQKILLLTWITIPLVLFSSAQTKIGWYIILIYPAIALLISAAIVELLGGSRAVAVLALAAAILYFRLPAIVDGSPDVKRFAKGVTHIMSRNEALYVYREPEPANGGTLAHHDYSGAQNVRPSLIYYLGHPLVCMEIDDQHATERAHGAYVVLDRPTPALRQRVDSVLLREGDYILGRARELSFKKC